MTEDKTHLYGMPDTKTQPPATEGLRGEGVADGEQAAKGVRQTMLNGKPVQVEEESGIAAAEVDADLPDHKG